MVMKNRVPKPIWCSIYCKGLYIDDSLSALHQVIWNGHGLHREDGGYGHNISSRDQSFVFRMEIINPVCVCVCVNPVVNKIHINVLFRLTKFST